jgi:hypothetical protein
MPSYHGRQMSLHMGVVKAPVQLWAYSVSFKGGFERLIRNIIVHISFGLVTLLRTILDGTLRRKKPLFQKPLLFGGS